MSKITPQDLNAIFENVLEDEDKILWVSELIQEPGSIEYAKDIFVSENVERLTGVTREAMFDDWQNFLRRLADIGPTNTFSHVKQKIINRTTDEPNILYCLEGEGQEKIFIQDKILCSLQHKESGKTFNTGVIKIISAEEYEKFSPASNAKIPESLFNAMFGDRKELEIIKSNSGTIPVKTTKPFLTMADNKIVMITRRESECLRYLLEGMSSKAIARKLNISPRTVEIHIASVKDKAGTSKRIELLSKIKDVGNF